MSTGATFVIVGAGLAGAKAAETLRTEGFDGRVVLLGEEPERPYDRPPLSKAYLRGEAGREALYLHDEGFYDEYDIELRTSARVRSIDPARRRVELAAGEPLRYDRLLLATGAAPRRLRVPGADLDGVHYLRDVADADRLAAAIGRVHHVAVIGTGWIGSEVAASARELGKQVTLIGRDSGPMARVLGPEVAGFYRQAHADHGVRLLPGAEVAAFAGTRAVEAVVTGDGRTIPCDLAVVGVGATPRSELAEAGGLAVRDGVLVDERLQAVGAAGVYAAGDVAAAWHPRYQARLRVEHWANALNQGPAAARGMLGATTPYERIPYFYSDQYDLGMEYTGFAPTWDRVVLRGDPAARAFIAFWIEDGRVVAGMHVNVWDVVAPIQDLIRSRRPVDPEQLADPDVPLEALAGQPGDARLPIPSP